MYQQSVLQPIFTVAKDTLNTKERTFSQQHQQIQNLGKSISKLCKIFSYSCVECYECHPLLGKQLFDSIGIPEFGHNSPLLSV